MGLTAGYSPQPTTMAAGMRANIRHAEKGGVSCAVISGGRGFAGGWSGVAVLVWWIQQFSLLTEAEAEAMNMPVPSTHGLA